MLAEELPVASTSTTPTGSKTETEYQLLIREERGLADNEHTMETIASGAAAIVIGLYGYYNTDPNPIVKLLYAATQTAGVLTIGQAMQSRNSPRLILEVDEFMKKAEPLNMRPEELKKILVEHKRKSARASNQTLAYSSSILSGLYLYNSLRETSEDKTLRNIYLFLSFNFALGGGVGFYRTYHDSNDDVASQLSVSIAPVPTVRYVF